MVKANRMSQYMNARYIARPPLGFLRRWPVVLADIGATVVSSVALQFMRNIPVGFHFDWHDAREYLQFGAPLLGSGILVFLLLT